MILNLDI
jgi:hypothetical protein